MQQMANQIEKKYYTIKLETIVPVELTFRVLAEDPVKATEMISKIPLPSLYSQPKLNLSRMKRLKATVYLAGSTMIEWIKTFNQ